MLRTMKNFDTIAAISTPPGKGGVALIRISGSEAIEVAAKVFLPLGNKDVTALPSRQVVYGNMLYQGEKIDDGMLTLFHAPNSYTGENIAEISCHGGVLITQTVLLAVLAAGARIAGAGEFTKRAYLNGKLSLSSAEAIGGVLEAKSREQLRLFSQDSRDILSRALATIYEDMAKLIATVYAKIDYPEEDLVDLSEQEIIAKMQEIKQKSEKLMATYATGRAITSGVKTVLCGKPNVGKSSLYNAFFGRDEAIVTDIAGTTRDVLHADIACGKVMLHLYDTAGLHESIDPVEQIGVKRAKTAIDEAELVLFMLDATAPLDAQDIALLVSLKETDKKHILLLNKSDKVCVLTPDDLSAYSSNILRVSAKTGDLSSLVEKIEAMYISGSLAVGEDAIISTARQHAALQKSILNIETAIDALKIGLPIDACVSDFELALSNLGETDGRAVSEDIVSCIFQHFCVGK